jgi:hypothetical protein
MVLMVLMVLMMLVMLIVLRDDSISICGISLELFVLNYGAWVLRKWVRNIERKLCRFARTGGLNTRIYRISFVSVLHSADCYLDSTLELRFNSGLDFQVRVFFSFDHLQCLARRLGSLISVTVACRIGVWFFESTRFSARGGKRLAGYDEFSGGLSWFLSHLSYCILD